MKTTITILAVLTMSSAAWAEEAPAACPDATSQAAYAKCQLDRSIVAERAGDIRLALSLTDEAARGLWDKSVSLRSIVLRERLGRRWVGYTREAVHACGQLSRKERRPIRKVCQAAATRLIQHACRH